LRERPFLVTPPHLCFFALTLFAQGLSLSKERFTEGVGVGILVVGADVDSPTTEPRFWRLTCKITAATRVNA
jgi:hypothetical protein